MGAEWGENTLALLQLLSKDIGIDILRFLHGKKWYIASDVARSLGVHTTTAQKYLTKMHEMGVLERRVRVCKTRRTFEFLLKRRKIQIELDVSELFQDSDALPEAVSRFYFTTFFAIVQGARKIGGSQIDAMVRNNITRLKAEKKGEALQFLRCLERNNDVEHSVKCFQHKSFTGTANASSIKTTFFELMSGIIGSYEAHMGKSVTQRMVEVSCEDILRDNAFLIEKYGLLADLPEDYFSVKGGEKHEKSSFRYQRL